MATQRKRKKATKKAASAATVGYEKKLWEMADALRGSMDAAEYKHVVLGRSGWSLTWNRWLEAWKYCKATNREEEGRP